jgi:hypothetical protein
MLLGGVLHQPQGVEHLVDHQGFSEAVEFS